MFCCHMQCLSEHHLFSLISLKTGHEVRYLFTLGFILPKIVNKTYFGSFTLQFLSYHCNSIAVFFLYFCLSNLSKHEIYKPLQC